jgi:hypothetical protein
VAAIGQFARNTSAAAEAAIDFVILTARLKPRPFKPIQIKANSNQSEFKLTRYR